MKIELLNISKRFQHEWIFKNLNYEFSSTKKYAILGSNGSGKSTLLQIIAANISPSEGEIRFQLNGNIIPADRFFTHISICAPYLELIEEFTFQEIIDFHFQFKKYQPGITSKQLLELSTLEKYKNRVYKTFSSGMKQRVKLILSLLSDTSVLLLDEPCTNLDAAGISWYHEMIEIWTTNRLVIVSSNQPQEYEFSEYHIQLADFK